MSDEPARGRKPWRRWVVGLAAAAALLACMAYLIRDRGLRGGLAAQTAELDANDPGWRIEDILAARPDLDAEQNSVPRVLAITRTLPPAWPDAKEEKKLEGLPANRVFDAARRAALDGLLAGTPREAARDLGRFPRGRFPVTLPAPWLTVDIPDHPRARTVGRLLALDATALALDGKPDEALASARAGLTLARSLDDDLTLMGHMIRIAVQEMAFTAAARAMAMGEPSDAALAAVQAEARAVPYTVALRTERALMHSTFQSMARGELDPADLTRSMGMLTPAVFTYGGQTIRRESIRHEHPRLLRIMTRVVENSRLPASEQFDAEDEVEREMRATHGVFTRLLSGMFSGVGRPARRAACLAAAMRTAIAVERYRIKNKEWPAKLDDVVPAFLDKVPPDPIDERPLRYGRTADGVVVYSIGNDRKDDGGDVEKMQKDLGYRLWDVDKRRTPP